MPGHAKFANSPVIDKAGKCPEVAQGDGRSWN